MKLSDVEKMATSGPWFVKRNPNNLPGYYIGTGDVVSDLVATVYSDSDLADAALIVHREKHWSKLLGELSWLVEYAGYAFDHMNCDGYHYDEDRLEKIQKLIAEAGEVEGM